MKWLGMGFGLAIGALLLAGACAEKSPLEKLIENRSRYKAEINGFYVDARPMVSEGVEAGLEAEGEEEAEPTAGDIEVEELTPVPVVQSAHLDILVKHDSAEKLPGVTLDVVQVDSALSQKGRWLVWVDTSKVERANPTQYSHVLEGIDYEEGDGFNVEVRHPIPEAERGDYREFSNVGP